MADVILSRIASHDDITDLHSLINSCYRKSTTDAAAVTGWTTEGEVLGGQRVDPVMLREIIDDTTGVLIVFHYHDALAATDAPPQPLIGCVHVQRQAATAHYSQSPRAYFGMLSTRPTLQSSGIGAHMIATAERYVRSVWPDLLIMECTVVHTRATLIAYYQRRGYVMMTEYGLEEFPLDEERYGRPLVHRDELRFATMQKVL